MEMKFREILQYGLMAIFLLGNTIAMDENEELVIGCRPWDKNVEEFQGLNTAHFVDFQIAGAPEQIPAKFHHLDINNKGVNGSGNFSEFASKNPGKFKTIIID